MTQISEKWLKYVRKWLNYLTIGLKMWKNDLENSEIPKYLGNGLDAWGTPYVFEKRLYYV